MQNHLSSEEPENLWETKLIKLRAILWKMEGVLVAFSGGIDSTLLLRVAQEMLGNRVMAVTAVSEITPRQEEEDALRLARLVGAAHKVLKMDDLEDAAFAANPEDRCYLCKIKRFTRLKSWAQDRGFSVVTDGSNLDDFSDFRPGMRALVELGIRSPLCEAGMNKQDIRRISRELKLPTWNKPASACLASRIPYHQPLTVRKLQQIEKGEIFLRDLNLSRQIRVRHHGTLARLEVEAADVHHLVCEPIRSQLVEYFHGLGFTYVTLDLEGYSMGSLNREI